MNILSEFLIELIGLVDSVLVPVFAFLSALIALLTGYGL